MTTHAQFASLLDQVQRGCTAQWALSIEGRPYLRRFVPGERLILLGGGTIAQALSPLAAGLGFSVVVVDDRPAFANFQAFPQAAEVFCDSFSNAIHTIGIRPGDYVAVMTRGHRFDAQCLRAVLEGPLPRYLGMVASRRRAIQLLNTLETEGFQRAALDTIHTPIGLELNAITPEEIAVSIAAELIQCRRSGFDRHCKSTSLPNCDADPALLAFLADPTTKKVVLLVYETAGSTPVKAGAMMALGQDLRTMGTIGGGCGEHQALMAARNLFSTEQSFSFTVDLSQDLAAEEGMACGGQMKIWLSCVM